MYLDNTIILYILLKNKYFRRKILWKKSHLQMIALEYGIFDSFESKEIFRVGYANLVEQVHGIQKELDRMTSQIQKDSEEEIA